MKKILIIIFIFTYCSICLAQNKSGIIEYAIAAVDVPLLDNKPRSEMLSNIIEIAKSQKFELKFNNNASSFNQILLLDIEQYDENTINLAKIAYTTTDAYFLDVNRKELLTKTAENILLKSSSINSGWKILTETKKIDNYLCYKAIYEYEYVARNNTKKTKIITAWFAPSLPFPFGPIEFHGLPGLILELNKDYTTYQAVKISLINEHIKIDFPKGKTITQEEYEKKALSGN
ncbi:GLPGLI family protein [Flavobacterium sp. j3]|uniref:GLPGLI family protein n=1 Tax=Flavobacterium aureirubrum TaxID=3133147 RepID=A0ABU9N509_9FLAO